jgi:hypothetical protein
MKPSFKTSKYENLLGIDNKNDATKVIQRQVVSGSRITFVRFTTATNVDIHKDNRITRCDGYALSLSGSYTSVWSNNKLCLALHNGDLVRIWENFSTTIIMSSVGDGEMAYEILRDGYIVFTNGTIIGQLKDEIASLFPATTREFKAVMPAGNMLAYFQGSLYVVKGNVVYISDVINPRIYDQRWGFKQFDSDITMFVPVSDGIWVSDANYVYFMRREGSFDNVIATPKFTLEKKYDTSAVTGTAQKVYDVTSPEGKKFEQAIVWVSGNTFCFGGDGGSFETIHSDIYSVPSGRIGTSMIRKNGNLNQYLTIIK